MDMSNNKLDFDLDLDYDKEKQEEPEVHERLKLYKLKYAKRFIIIKYSLLILQLVNVLILWSFLYWDIIFKLIYKNTDSTNRI